LDHERGVCCAREQGETNMRVMMVMYRAETGAPPESAAIQAGMDFNQRLIDAGVWVEGEGLYPSSMHGARVRFAKGKSIVTDGPFTETKEVFGGYWILNVGSMAEAIEWARQAPMPDGEVIEVRRVIESADFDEDSKAREEKMHEQMARAVS
jgi:hypothetical protein